MCGFLRIPAAIRWLYSNFRRVGTFFTSRGFWDVVIQDNSDLSSNFRNRGSEAGTPDSKFTGPATDAFEMADFLLSTGIAGIGYVAGILSKPIQEWIADKRDEKKLRKILYTEMAEAIGRSVVTRNNPLVNKYASDGMDYLLNFGKFPCYEYASTKPVALNHLPEATAIKKFYAAGEGVYKKLLEKQLLTSGEILSHLHWVIMSWGELIKLKSLDRNYLLKVGDKAQIREFIDASDNIAKWL